MCAKRNYSCVVSLLLFVLWVCFPSINMRCVSIGKYLSRRYLESGRNIRKKICHNEHASRIYNVRGSSFFTLHSRSGAFFCDTLKCFVPPSGVRPNVSYLLRGYVPMFRTLFGGTSVCFVPPTALPDNVSYPRFSKNMKMFRAPTFSYMFRTLLVKVHKNFVPSWFFTAHQYSSNTLPSTVDKTKIWIRYRLR